MVQVTHPLGRSTVIPSAPLASGAGFAIAMEQGRSTPMEQHGLRCRCGDLLSLKKDQQPERSAKFMGLSVFFHFFPAALLHVCSSQTLGCPSTGAAEHVGCWYNGRSNFSIWRSLGAKAVCQFLTHAPLGGV